MFYSVKFSKMTGKNFTTDEILQNSTILQVYFSTMQTQTISISSAYSFMALLSDIGGALGLLLGATLLTAVEVAGFGLQLIHDFIKKEHDHRRKRFDESGVPNMATKVITVAGLEDASDK